MRQEVSASQPRVWPIVWKASALAVLIFVVAIAILMPRACVTLMLPDQTVYSEGFSESRFGQIRPGMTEREVLEVIGRPMSVTEHTRGRVYETSWSETPSAVAGVEFRWWTYSKPGRLSESYEMRAVKLSPEGRVLEVIREHYAD